MVSLLVGPGDTASREWLAMVSAPHPRHSPTPISDSNVDLQRCSSTFYYMEPISTPLSSVPQIRRRTNRDTGPTMVWAVSYITSTVWITSSTDCKHPGFLPPASTAWKQLLHDPTVGSGKGR